MTVHLTVHDRGRELEGVVREGESWAAAARRTCGGVHGEPVPVDLSGAVKHFSIDHETTVAVRAMSRGDLADVVRWRRAEHVHQWWVSNGDPTPQRVEEQYGPDIDGMTPTRMWVAEVNGRSLGFCQDYRVRDYPEFALLAPDSDAVGVDYAIGDPAWVGRGLGVRILWAWMLRSRHRFPEVTAYFAAPDHRNQASLRMLDKVGFDRGLWFDEPQADGTVATVVGCTLDVRRVLG
jgi:aminoglycoside 6'-N-acetyltransferase